MNNKKEENKSKNCKMQQIQLSTNIKNCGPFTTLHEDWILNICDRDLEMGFEYRDK